MKENCGKTSGRLTKWELEILELVASGLTAAQIAAQLYLTLITVETHKRNIVLKMDAKNTTEAVVKAMRRGIIK